MCDKGFEGLVIGFAVSGDLCSRALRNFWYGVSPSIVVVKLNDYSFCK
ncbi:hypothetical protein Ngar_c22530 [Candidatus Nitrososphaera gargensis Ga9.2]|uniref:Uncharacterized protein n=1 Tax=Nitrososphaera gargensis (strain Ga9.2) TaxID=1237085 RepID=K0IJA8_NITGG|nr:hypothetical protein Ngar_c22530 [Candidatus Nitrososphaera gargensis Ga9.2]